MVIRAVSCQLKVQNENERNGSKMGMHIILHKVTRTCTRTPPELFTHDALLCTPSTRYNNYAVVSLHCGCECGTSIKSEWDFWSLLGANQGTRTHTHTHTRKTAHKDVELNIWLTSGIWQMQMHCSQSVCVYKWTIYSSTSRNRSQFCSHKQEKTTCIVEC